MNWPTFCIFVIFIVVSINLTPVLLDVAVCRLPAERGNCRKYTVRWFYNSTESRQRCERFWYGGCNGNENNFETEDLCVQKCSPRTGKYAFLSPFPFNF